MTKRAGNEDVPAPECSQRRWCPVLSEKPDSATSHRQLIDGVVDEMGRQVHPSITFRAGPWPVAADTPGIGDDVHRALLVDDWAESGMRAKQLQRLIDVQLVARNRQYGADHPNGRDFGIIAHGVVVGRVLLDLDEDIGAEEYAAGDTAIRLADISIHPQHQRQGIGGSVLRALLASAAKVDRPVRASAVFGTPALRQFLNAGFVEIGGDVLFHQLEWRP